MKDRTVTCKYYTHECGPCDKRNICVRFWNECQTCSQYEPLPNMWPARTDTRKQRLERINRKEYKDDIYNG